jgi:pimeloyl-ACP methyl ester carboxylesterase
VSPAYTVLAPIPSASTFFVFLHGILGDRSNWRTVARRVIEARSGVAAVLVDQRGHGEAHGFPPPHTVAAAALDVLAVERELLDAHPSARVASVLGHSFGGKVAIAYARARASAGDLPALDTLWICDTALGGRTRGDRPRAIGQVVEVLRSAPARLESREELIAHLTGHGISPPVAGWLGKSVRRTSAGDFALALELPVVDALLDDYFALDFWAALERPTGAGETHYVVGERSDVVSPADRARALEIARGAPTVHVHEIADAGHWLHVDAPDAVIDLLLTGGGARA